MNNIILYTTCELMRCYCDQRETSPIRFYRDCITIEWRIANDECKKRSVIIIIIIN